MQMQDFLSMQPCISSIARTHFAMHDDDHLLVNSFCRIPTWERVHFDGNEELPIWVNEPRKRAELLTVAVMSCASNHLTLMQQQELQALLDEFADVFSPGRTQLGLIDPALGLEHVIDTGDADPVTQVPYRHSHYESVFLREQVDDFLLQGAIRPSKSAWMSPTMLVKKPDNDLRFCIDFRAVNKVTLRDPYPVPRIDVCLDKMAGCKYFTSVDVVSAFWQVPIAEDDIHKTGFCTPFGNFEWLRTPFGLVIASSTFQRLMDDTLHGLDLTYPYIDDVFVYSKGWTEHIRSLRAVLMRLHASCLKLKLPKCIFAALSVGALVTLCLSRA